MIPTYCDFFLHIAPPKKIEQENPTRIVVTNCRQRGGNYTRYTAMISYWNTYIYIYGINYDLDLYTRYMCSSGKIYFYSSRIVFFLWELAIIPPTRVPTTSWFC